MLHEYLSNLDGRHSYKMTSEKKKEAGLNVCANNDPSEQQFELLHRHEMDALGQTKLQISDFHGTTVTSAGQQNCCYLEGRVKGRMWVIRQLVYFMSYLLSYSFCWQSWESSMLKRQIGDTTIQFMGIPLQGSKKKHCM